VIGDAEPRGRRRQQHDGAARARHLPDRGADRQEGGCQVGGQRSAPLVVGREVRGLQQERADAVGDAVDSPVLRHRLREAALDVGRTGGVDRQRVDAELGAQRAYTLAVVRGDGEACSGTDEPAAERGADAPGCPEDHVDRLCHGATLPRAAS